MLDRHSSGHTSKIGDIWLAAEETLGGEVVGVARVIDQPQDNAVDGVLPLPDIRLNVLPEAVKDAPVRVPAALPQSAPGELQYQQKCLPQSLTTLPKSNLQCLSPSWTYGLAIFGIPGGTNSKGAN